MKRYPKQPSNVTLLAATCLVGSALFASRGVADPGDYATYSDAYKAGLNARVARDYPKSRDGWENAIALAQGPRQRIAAMLGLARTALEQNQFVEAEKLSHDVLVMPVESVQSVERLRAHTLLRDIYRKQGRTKEAAQQMTEVQRLLPPQLGVDANGRVTNKTLATYGSLLGADVKDKSPEQIRVALEVLVQNPKTPAFNRRKALSLLGDIALEAQQPTVARDFYSRAIAVPTGPQLYQWTASLRVQLGDACAAEGDWKAARQAYESALSDTYEELKPIIKAKRDAAAKAETQNA